ncbi:hypothetical protein EGW08_022571, partial [Elysia chlorotica]
NYQYLIYDDIHAILVDPLREGFFTDFIEQNNLTITAILITHKHGDHIAGVNDIVAKNNDVKVYAYADNERFSPDVYVKDGDVLEFGYTTIKVLYTPGHIADHVSYLFVDEKDLFCGDTVFNAGVGGVSAKTANVNELYDSIVSINDLDEQTKLYPAHDYWQGNLDFALSILPNDEKFMYYRKNVAELEADDKPILTIKEERELNIFFR